MPGASLAGPPDGIPTGAATLRLRADGTYATTLSDGGVPHGTYSVQPGGIFELRDKLDNSYCRAGLFPGTYAYAINADKLTITMKSDPRSCADRTAAFVGTWTRSD